MSRSIVAANRMPGGPEMQPISNLNVSNESFVKYPGKLVQNAMEVLLRESVCGHKAFAAVWRYLEAK